MSSSVRYVGLDVHKRIVEACILGPSGKVTARHRFDNLDRETLTAFARRHLRRSDRVALEASTNTWAVVEILQPQVAEVVVSNPMQTKAIAQAKVKTDKVDAETLAQLLRADLIPRSWVPSRDIRDLRQLVRQRAYLVRQASRFKNRIHAEMLRRGIRRPENLRTPFAQRSIRWMRSLDIPTVTSCLNCLENIQA